MKKLSYEQQEDICKGDWEWWLDNRDIIEDLSQDVPNDKLIVWLKTLYKMRR